MFTAVDGSVTATSQASLCQRCSVSTRTRTFLFQVDAVVQGFHEMMLMMVVVCLVWC